MPDKICRKCQVTLRLKTVYHHGGMAMLVYECPECGDLLDREKVDDGLLWNRGILKVVKK